MPVVNSKLQLGVFLREEGSVKVLYSLQEFNGEEFSFDFA